MLIARAPLRISFFGGGTDVPAYYKQYGGSVISTSIDKYFYVHLQPINKEALQIISADFREIFSQESYSNGAKTETLAELNLTRAVLKHFGVEQGLNLFSASEVPPGTGLASSSAAAVGLIKALSTYQRQPMSKPAIAELASEIEIERLGMPIGKQDQYASAFGGLNIIEFCTDDTVQVTPVNLSVATLEALQDRLMLFYTGTSRHSTSILSGQKSAVMRGEKDVVAGLHALKELVQVSKKLLENEDLDGFGKLLHTGWEYKRQLSDNVSNSYIDEAYNAARTAGALGGKIAGAGGGGFLLLYALPEQQAAITEKMRAAGLRRLYFKFDTSGAAVVLDA